MNSYTRVHMAFTKEKSDQVPIYCCCVSSRVASAFLGHEAYVGGGIQQWREVTALWRGGQAHQEYLERSREDALQWARVGDYDFVRRSYWRMPVKPDERIDENTFRFRRGDGTEYVMRFFPESELFSVIHDTAVPITDPDDLEPVVEKLEQQARDFVAPDIYEDYRWAMQQFNWQRSMEIGGLAVMIPNTQPVWYEAVVARPDLVDRYLETQLITSLKTIPMIAANGARIAFGGGDCAGNTGLIYSPRVFREMLVPRFRKISEECKRYGLFHCFGSDGNIWSVADDLYVDAGIAGHYELDVRAGMGVRAVREKYPHITVIGGISVATVETGTPEEITSEVTEAMTAAKELGGAIIGPSNLLSPSTPIKNVELMLELMHKLR